MKVQLSQLVAFIVPQAISKDPSRFVGVKAEAVVQRE